MCEYPYFLIPIFIFIAGVFLAAGAFNVNLMLIVKII